MSVAATPEAFPDYELIRLWGKRMVSGKYYIDKQVELARKENAPWNVVYRQSKYIQDENRIEYVWVTLDQINNPNVFIDFGIHLPARLNCTVSVHGVWHFDSEEAAEKFLAENFKDELDGLYILKVDNTEII